MKVDLLNLVFFQRLHSHFEDKTTNTGNCIRIDWRDHPVWVAATGAVEIAGHCSCELDVKCFDVFLILKCFDVFLILKLILKWFFLVKAYALLSKAYKFVKLCNCLVEKKAYLQTLRKINQD